MRLTVSKGSRLNAPAKGFFGIGSVLDLKRFKSSISILGGIREGKGRRARKLRERVGRIQEGRVSCACLSRIEVSRKVLLLSSTSVLQDVSEMKELKQRNSFPSLVSSQSLATMTSTSRYTLDYTTIL